MPLRDFQCKACSFTFEKLVLASEKTPINCPQCGGTELRKMISLFAVGGRGDLRESTWHGCHGPHEPTDDMHTNEHHGHTHSHDHSHSSEDVSEVDHSANDEGLLAKKTGTEN